MMPSRTTTIVDKTKYTKRRRRQEKQTDGGVEGRKEGRGEKRKGG